jgi:hypothetical protein
LANAPAPALSAGLLAAIIAAPDANQREPTETFPP